MNVVVNLQPPSNYMYGARAIECCDLWNIVGIYLEYSWNIPIIFQLYSNSITMVITYNCVGNMHMVWSWVDMYNKAHDLIWTPWISLWWIGNRVQNICMAQQQLHVVTFGMQLKYIWNISNRFQVLCKAHICWHPSVPICAGQICLHVAMPACSAPISTYAVLDSHCW